MPNGRSGGFHLQVVAFQRLLEQHSGEMVVGRTPDTRVTAAEVMRLLREWTRDQVPIEEQDHSWYIVHLSKWVAVGEDSPIFSALRHAHVEFLKKVAEEQR